MEINALHLLKPKIRVGNSEYAAKQFQYLLRSSKRKRSSRYAFARGSSIFFREHTRDRRVIVKVSYAKNTTKRSWAAHGRYLQREHAQAVDQKGLGFSELKSEVNLKETLKSWQNTKDPHFFKIILSPENADKLDLKTHTRELMEQVSRDLKTKIEWIAIDHHNTDQDHVHILVRGIDDKGKALTIDPTYISDGIRKRSQEIVTRKLGLRTLPEMNMARAKQIHKEYVTEIDRVLRFRAQDGIVSFGKLKQDNAKMRERRLQDIKRLKFLETLSLAERVGEKIWRLSPQLESTLNAIQLSNDIIKSRAQHGLSISDYSNLLSNTPIEHGSGITGKVIGANLENTPQVISALIPSAIDAMTLTDIDRCLRMKSVEGVVHYEKAIPYSFNARKQRLNEIARLKFLESLNLAEKIGAKRWRLSETLEKELSKLQPNLANHHSSLASPTVIDGDHPLTGKVVGMGLDNELNDRRYMLIEGLDGKIHYVQATDSIVKLRDQLKMKNGDVISLKQRIFHSEEEKKSIAYLHLDNHGQDLSNLNISVLDEVLMNHIKIKNSLPDFAWIEKTFGEDVKLKIQNRFHELVANQIIVEKENEWHFNVNHLNLLDDLHHRRHGEYQVWQPHLDETQKPIVGKVIESNDRVMLVQDSCGQYFQVNNRHLGIDHGLKLGAEVYLRKRIERHQNKLNSTHLEIKPCMFTVLNPAKIKMNKSEFVLLDRILFRVNIEFAQCDFSIIKKLKERRALWQSRGIEIGKDFEKQARNWLEDSQTLLQVQTKNELPLYVIRDTGLKTYSGTVVAMGSYDQKHHTYLVLKTEKELLALMMRPEVLRQYQLDQEIELNYRYRNFIDHQIQKQKRLKLSDLPKK